MINIKKTTFSIFLFTLVFLNLSCENHESKIESEISNKVVEVAVEVPKLNNYTDPMTISGIVKSHQRATLSSKITGQIVDITVDEGNPIKFGELLLKIDDREARIKMAEIQTEGATLRSQRQELIEKLSELKNRVQMLFHDQESFLSEAELAQSTFERYKKLLDKDVISKQEYDEAKTKLDMTNAAVAKSQAEYNVLIAQKKQLDAKNQQLLSEIEKNKILAANATVDMSYTQITSPLNGFLVKKYVDIGDMATEGKALLVVENAKALYLEINVDESQAFLFKPGTKLEVFADATPQKRIIGIIREVINSADPETHTFKVKIDIQPTNFIHPGMYARAIILMGGENIFIPRTAIVTRGQIQGVFVVDNKNIARFRIIKAGQDIQGFVPVISGLNDSDKVVISNVDQVNDGTKVKVLGDK